MQFEGFPISALGSIRECRERKARLLGAAEELMCDRTDEFRLLVASLPSHPPPNNPPLQPAVATLQEFHGTTSGIAKGIHQCSQKLVRLTKLVQNRGLFSDPAAEINSLVFAIKEDVSSLNSQLDSAQTYVDHKKQQLGATSQPANHSVQVVGQLKTELLFTTKSFKDVLETRSSNLKAQHERKDVFFSKQSAVTMGKPAAYRPLTPLRPLRPPQGSHGSQERLPRPSGTSLPPDEEEDARAPLIAPSGPTPQQQQQQQQMVAVDQSYMNQRANAMQDVEAHIQELGTVFNRLATMVQEQAPMVETLHANVDIASENVNRGQMALLSTLQSLQSNRRLAAKLSGILFLFLIFFVVFLS